MFTVFMMFKICELVKVCTSAIVNFGMFTMFIMIIAPLSRHRKVIFFSKGIKIMK